MTTYVLRIYYISITYLLRIYLQVPCASFLHLLVRSSRAHKVQCCNMSLSIILKHVPLNRCATCLFQSVCNMSWSMCLQHVPFNRSATRPFQLVRSMCLSIGLEPHPFQAIRNMSLYVWGPWGPWNLIFVDSVDRWAPWHIYIYIYIYILFFF